MRRRFPPYPKRPHSSGQARIAIAGRTCYLGKFDTPESRAEYRRLMAEWEQGQLQPPATGDGRRARATVTGVLAAYGAHAKGRYSAKQWDRIRRAMHIVRELYGHTVGDDFRLGQLETVRGEMLKAAWSRPYVNAMIGCIRRAFRWGAQRGMVTESCAASLALLEGLRAGQPGLREPPRTEPAQWEHVRRTLRHLRPPVRAMVLLQWFAGMRTQEVLLMRGRDIDRSRTIWVYQPSQHKNSWRNQERVVYLGPMARRILAKFLRCRADSQYLFSPRDAMAGIPGAARASLRDHYSNETYSRAVARACVAANVPHWHPYQLRHAAATRVAREFDPETARLLLGQKTLTATRRYVVDSDRGADAASRLG